MDLIFELNKIIVDLNLVWPTTDSAPNINFGRYDDQPHQHVPLARLSSSNWKGLLISDEVGLGKTISAISILRSLHSRGYTGGVLITCPGALRLKWKNELWHRGDIQCIEATSGKQLIGAFERIRNGEPLVVVASHGILRHSAVLSELNEKTPDLLITIVDEAHHIRNPRSRLHDAISFLSLKSKSIIFLTATPVNLSVEDLWVQLSHLAPDRWPTANSFANALAPGKLLNDILNEIAKPSPDLKLINDQLRRLELTAAYHEDIRLKELIQIIRYDGRWMNHRISEVRRDAADLIRQLRPLNELVVRTRRRDLDWNMPKRDALTLDVKLNPEEWDLYGEAKRLSLAIIKLRHPDNPMLNWALMIPERMASSCLHAFAEHVKNQAIEFENEDNLFDDDENSQNKNLVKSERRLLHRLGYMDDIRIAAEKLGNNDSKYEALRDWLRLSLQSDPLGGILLFSHFRGTLKHLQKRLTDDGFECKLVTGETSMNDREVIRTEFRNGLFDILLSSEVGSEGLDQEHCHRIVNYDLPWNPMRIEQRIGRIDRFGQMAENITILNFAVEGTIDAAILHRLYHRIRIFENTLGMLDPLLGKAIRVVAHGELDNIVETSSYKQEDGLNSLISKREKWLDERATESREWLGPDPGIEQVRNTTLELGLDLKTDSLRFWINQKLKSLDENAQISRGIDENQWILQLPRWIVENLSLRTERVELFDKWHVGWKSKITKLMMNPSPSWLTITFNRDLARDDVDLEYITPWHPIVQWLRSYSFEKDLQMSTMKPSNWKLVPPPTCKWFTTLNEDELPEYCKWAICLDWNTKGLKHHVIRRWLLLDNEGFPLEEQNGQEWKSINLVKSYLPNQNEKIMISNALLELKSGLERDEKSRLIPVLNELKNNARKAWHTRIDRELMQLEQSKIRANDSKKELDPRYERMKRGLIARLHVELQKRLDELEEISNSFQTELRPRLIIKNTNFIS